MWPDGSKIPLPADPCHEWFEGEPDDKQGLEDCSVMSNYRFWTNRKMILDNYVWRDYNCHFNPQEIQGYTCESKSYLTLIIKKTYVYVMKGK